MKICYVISAYKLPDQVVRLVKRLDSADSFFYIHVDKRTEDNKYQVIKDLLTPLKNVVLLKRHASYYGSFGHVRATLKGIGAALKSKNEFDYMVLLTGQDYPIKSTTQIHEYLKQNYAKSFISFYTLDDRFAGKWFERLGKIYLFNETGSHAIYGDKFISCVANKFWGATTNPKNKDLVFPEGLTPYFGNAYWVIHRNHIEYIDNFVRQHPNYVRFFKHSRVPDECFFHSILLNSNYRDEIVNNDLFYIDWSERRSSPAILTTQDFSKLMDSDDLFARKFDTTVDSAILDMIDKRIGEV